MENYKPNSNLYKNSTEEINKQRQQKIVSGKVITKKKNIFQKMSSEFISSDADNVISYIFCDILIPSIKKAIYSVIVDGTNMMLYGTVSKRDDRSSVVGRVSYNSYYDGPQSRIERRNEYRAARAYEYDDITLETRRDAEDVLLAMEDLLRTYGLVRVSDLYDFIGRTSEVAASSYGWMSLKNVEIVRVRDGYKLNLPKAMPID